MRFENVVLRPGGTQPRQESSRVGRSDAAEIGWIGPQAWALAEAQHRDMREPRPSLFAVQPRGLQVRLQIGRERCRTAALVGEDEHGDAAGLAVASGRKDDLPGPRGGLAERVADLGKPRQVDAAEEGQRDVQVLTPDEAAAARELFLPRDKLVEHAGGQPQGAEEPDPSTAVHATG